MMSIDMLFDIHNSDTQNLKIKMVHLSSIFLFAISAIDAAMVVDVRYSDFVKLTSMNLLGDDSIQLEFRSLNQTFSLLLFKNTHLVLADTTLQIHNDQTGEVELQQIIAHAYQGSTVYNGDEVGWARVLFDSDPTSATPLGKVVFDGALTKENAMYHINTIENYRLSRRSGYDIDIVSPLSRPDEHRAAKMIMFKDDQPDYTVTNHLHARNLVGEQASCGYSPNEASNLIKRADTNEPARLDRRQASGGACFSSKRAAASDCTYTTNFGGPTATLNRILNDWNLASQVYESTFNIQLALIEVKIMTGCGNFNGEVLPWNVPCSDAYTINDRLSSFSDWRGQRKDSVGLWHLMTKCNTGPNVGVAWLNMMCNVYSFQQSSNGKLQTVSGTGVSSIVPTEWKVVAHEIGHNFGAIHDCVSSSCPSTCASTATSSCTCCPCTDSCDCKGQYLMHPKDNSVLSQFSPCSISSMCAGINANFRCLVTPGSLKTISAGICGNGVAEGGEECDCGLLCANDACCDGTTCKYKDKATCDDLNEECCKDCQLKPSGSVCRASNDQCTISQNCDGTSGFCAESKKFDDGTACTVANGNSTGTLCASGICTSRDLQCKSLVNSGNSRTVSSCPGQDNQCALLCATSLGSCITLNGNFIGILDSLTRKDGTQCSGDGKCRSGQCVGGNFWGTIKYFFDSQPAFAIPVTIACSLLAVALAFCMIRGCCTRHKETKPLTIPVGNRVIPAPRLSDWVNPALYNGGASPVAATRTQDGNLTFVTRD